MPSGEKRDRAEAVSPLYMVTGFYFVFSAAIAVALCFFRWYLGGPGPAVFIGYWLTLVALIGSLSLGTLSGGRYLICFVGLLVTVMLLGAFDLPSWLVSAPVTVAVIVLLAKRCRHDCCARPRSVAILIVASLALASLYFLVINAMGLPSVFLPERLLAGQAYPDSFYHTAISEILVHYGVLGTALDGIVPIRYHAFSHLLFGLLAKGVHLNAAHGYYLAMQIVVLPLLLFSLSLAVLVFEGGRSHSAPAAAILLAVPLTILALVDLVDLSSYLDSESYAVGVCLLLAGLPLLRTIAGSNEKSVNGAASLAMAYAILLSTAKISVGAIWTIAVIILLVRAKRISFTGWIAVFGLLAIHAFVVIRYTLPNDNVATAGVGLLDFVMQFPMVAGVNFLIIGMAAFFHIRDWRKNRDRPWQEVSLVIFATSIGPALFLRIEGGAVYYFLNIGTWVAIASLSARLVGALEGTKYSLPVAVCVGICVLCALGSGQKLRAYQGLKEHRQALIASSEPDIATHFAHYLLADPRALRAVREASEKSVGARIGLLLDKVGIKPGEDIGVFVAPSFHRFWHLAPQCNVASFLIPSFYGVPLLEGLPPREEHCDLGTVYGYRFYEPDSRSRITGDAQLCEHALRRGLKHIAILEGVDAVRKLDCAGGSPSQTNARL